MEGARVEEVETNLDISKWLDYAKYAPSGGNQQLWKVGCVKIEDRQIYLKLEVDVPSKITFTDQQGAGALLSLGCYIATLCYTGRHFGFELLSESVVEGKSFWASHINLVFSRKPRIPSNSHLETVLMRKTHRGPYANKFVTEEEIEKLKSYLYLNQNLIDFTHDRKRVISFLSDSTLFRLIEAELFYETIDEIYVRALAPHRATGLPLDTLGLSRVSEFLLGVILKTKLFLPYAWVHRPTLIESVKSPLQRCSRVYYLASSSDSAADWVELGRALQKIWLYLTSKGLVMQPFANNLLIYNWQKSPQEFPLSPRSKSISQKWIKDFRSQIDFLKPGIFFRIGFAKYKAASSPRKPVETFS